MTRTLSRVVMKIVSGGYEPDTGLTVQLKTDEGTPVLLGTATESPAGSGQYTLSWTTTLKWGYWYVGGAKKTEWGPIWLGDEVADPSANQLRAIASGATSTEYKTLLGTSNQISVAHGVGTLTLSTPQDLATTSTVRFGKVGIGRAATAALEVEGSIIGKAATHDTSDYFIGLWAEYSLLFDEWHGAILSSGAHAIINIDADNNDGTRYFEVRHGATSTGGTGLFRVGEDGLTKIYGYLGVAGQDPASTYGLKLGAGSLGGLYIAPVSAVAIYIAGAQAIRSDNGIYVDSEHATSAFLRFRLGASLSSCLSLESDLSARFYGNVGIGTAPTTLALTFAQAGAQGSATFVSGYFGAGWKLYSLNNAHFLELDNLIIRHTLRAHIFQKDIVRASNGMFFISDATEVVADSALSDEDQNLWVKEAVFQAGDLVLYKDFYEDGGGLTIQECRIVITSGATSDTIPNSSKTGYRYDAYLVSPATYTVRVGATLTRIGSSVTGRKGSLYFDASSSYSPFIDIYDDVASWADFQSTAKIKARIGKLDGISDTLFGGALSGYGIWTYRGYFKGNIAVASSADAVALAASTIKIGNITGTATSAIKLSNTGTATTSGLFFYDASGNEIFAFRLDGTAQIAGWVFNNIVIKKTAATESDWGLQLGSYYGSLAKPSIAVWWTDWGGGHYLTMGGALYLATSLGMFTRKTGDVQGTGWDTDAGAGGIAVNVNSTTLFVVGKYNGVEGACIAGWNFNSSTLYNGTNPNIVGLRSGGTGKAFFAGATDTSGTAAKAYINFDGSAVFANGNITFETNGDINSVGYLVERTQLFGDGSDGDVTISSGTTTLTRDMYYNSLTINSGGILKPAGYRIFVKGQLTINSGGKIDCNGSAASAQSGGAGAAGANLKAGLSGSDGGDGGAPGGA